MKTRNGMSESEAGKLGAIASRETQLLQKQKRIDEYYLHPTKCMQCGNTLNYYKRINKFCCRSCAATYSNLHRDENVYKSVSDKLKIRAAKIRQLNPKKCKYCGQEICPHPEICKKYQVFKSLIKFGFDYSKVGTIDMIEEYNRVKNIIYNFYQEHNSNSKLLTKTFGYTSGAANFQKILKSLGIQSKNIKQATIDSYLNGNSVVSDSIYFNCSWHTTWDGKEVYLRSSYELDYAKELDDKQIIYEVECLRIKYFNTSKNEYHCAIPDFFLPDTNEIVEIKSTWTLKGKVQEMKDKFKEYINLEYKPKLILEHQEISIDNLSED